MGYVERVEEWLKHMKLRYDWVAGRFSIRKLANIVRNKYEFYQKRIQLKSFPVFATIEVTNVCNLHCPHCATGRGLSKRKKGYMTFEHFRSIVDQLPNLTFVNLGPNGEPFLNREIFNMARYLNRLEIMSGISTNFNISHKDQQHKKFIDRIISSGLDELAIGIDGVCEDTYVRYRKGGDFHLVMNLLKRLVKRKHELHSNKPRITWQFVVMKHNEHEIPRAKRLAKELKVDRLMFMRFVPLSEFWYFDINDSEYPPEDWLPENTFCRVNDDRVFMYNCNFPFTQIHILYDGTVVPCCRLVEKNVRMANILEQPFDEIWNNQLYLSFRKQLLEQGKKSRCKTCLSNYHAYLRRTRTNNEKPITM